jgi:Protein of unknown function (DUF3108)
MSQFRFLFLACLFAGCSTLNYLKYAKEEEFRRNSEFEKQVVVKELEPLPESETAQQTVEIQNSEKSIVDKEVAAKKSLPKTVKPNKAKAASKKAVVEVEKPKTRQPDIEDSEGFDHQRRPLVIPFLIGEKVTHSVRYFATEAATMDLEIRPFIEVNQRKAYRLNIALKTSSLFSKFYSVDNTVETYLDYEKLVPYVHKYTARESGKLVQSHSFFDQDKLKATFWEKKYTEKNGEEKKELSWDILPFSQNAFSGIFYMRVFKWTIGKEYSFRVADDEKNIIFKGTAIAKEKLETDAGEFNAIKIKASVVSRGALTQAGNLYVWLSDDDRKIVLKLEAEIKIGKIVSEIVSYRPGK